MFIPPFCPHADCVQHRDAADGFYRRKGFYHPKCRSYPVPRFQCRSCGRGFSRQTFHYSYAQKKPWLDLEIIEELVMGVGLRPLARKLGISRCGLDKKVRRMAEHLRGLHLNLLRDFPGLEVRFQLDELETFETCRRTQPVTVPVLIASEAMFIVDACADTIPASGKMTPARRRAIARLEATEGKRRNRSREACLRVLTTAAQHVPASTWVRFDTDKKKSYPGVIREAFAEHAVSHFRTVSTRKRDTKNPLFWINLMNAKLRANMGRLRRRSWFVSKKRAFLRRALWVTLAVMNYAWPWRNDAPETPAMLAGMVERPIDPGQLLSWGQRWGDHSLHPGVTPPATIRAHRRSA